MQKKLIVRDTGYLQYGMKFKGSSWSQDYVI